jgi:hypothetical protein
MKIYLKFKYLFKSRILLRLDTEFYVSLLFLFLFFLSVDVSDKHSSANYPSGLEIDSCAHSSDRDSSHYDNKNLRNKSLSINNCSSNNGHKREHHQHQQQQQQHQQQQHQTHLQQKPLSSSVNNFGPASNYGTNSSLKNSSSHAPSTGQEYCDKSYHHQQQQPSSSSSYQPQDSHSKNGNNFINAPSTSYNQELMLNDSNDSSSNTLNLKNSSPNYTSSGSNSNNFSNTSSNQNISGNNKGNNNNAQYPHQQSGSTRSSRSYNPSSNQTLIGGSCQGSFHSLHGATSSDYQLQQQQLNYGVQTQHSQQQAQQYGHHSHQQGQGQHQHQQPQHQATNLVRQQHSITSNDSLNGSGTLVYSSGRSRVNSDSNKNSSNNNSFKTSNSNNNNNNGNNNNSTKSNVANGANNNNKLLNKSNNTILSSNSSNPSDSNQLRQRHIIELNRQVSELNNKNIEFNRQLSAPTENQNSYNSVYNLYSNHILNNQYHSGSPNTNSLNRTKKKRSFKLNGR